MAHTAGDSGVVIRSQPVSTNRAKPIMSAAQPIEQRISSSAIAGSVPGVVMSGIWSAGHMTTSNRRGCAVPGTGWSCPSTLGTSSTATRWLVPRVGVILEDCW